MKKVGLIGLVSVVLLGIIVLTGYCEVCTPEIQTCSLTVVAKYYVWGEVYINGQPTGEYIDYQSCPAATIMVSCNQTVLVYIVDYCGYQSHAETMFISLGQNYLYFEYW